MKIILTYEAEIPDPSKVSEVRTRLEAALAKASFQTSGFQITTRTSDVTPEALSKARELLVNENDDMDMLVHDLASQEGSDANNGGLDNQLRWVADRCKDDKEFMATLGLKG